jgi:hypothetical protein
MDMATDLNIRLASFHGSPMSSSLLKYREHAQGLQFHQKIEIQQDFLTTNTI